MALTERVPGMRRGSHIWNSIVAVAYLVLPPLLMSVLVACLWDQIGWEC